MEKISATWPGGDTGCLVHLFAERMLELVHDFSWDNYRHFTIDTLGRLNETAQICIDVQKEVVPRTALDPALEELAWSVTADPVLSADKTFDSGVFISLIEDKNRSVESLRVLLLATIRKFEKSYQKICETLLLKCLSKPKEKSAFLNTAQFYCAFLISRGFHRKYLEECIQNTFANKDHSVNEAASFEGFFKCFANEASDYIFVTKGDRHFANALKKIRITSTATSKTINPDYTKDAPNFFTLKDKQLYIIIDELKTLDAYSARDRAEELIGVAKAIILAVPNKLPLERASSAYLIKDQEKSGKVLSAPPSPLQRREFFFETSSLRAISKLADNVFNKFDMPSVDRIMRAYSTGALARTSSNPESQLISLWSAIEVLLSEPSSKTPRIIHYVDLLAPCLCIKYARSCLVHFFNDIQKIYDKKLSEILNAVPNNGDSPHSKFIKLICASELNDLQQRFIKMCQDSPLAMNRASSLQTKFGSPAAMHETVARHEKFVRWQLHRIYRVRNQLVHSGSNPQFLGSVLGNLDEYFRTAIGVILGRARYEDNSSNIDEVVSGISFEYKTYMTRLRVNSGLKNFSPNEVLSYFPR